MRPLDTIRLGTLHEVGDAMDIATLLAAILGQSPAISYGNPAASVDGGNTMTGPIFLALILARAPPEVAPQTILAIIQVESRGDPWAIGINLPGQDSRSAHPTSAAAAMRVVKAVLAQGDVVIYRIRLTLAEPGNAAAMGAY